MTIPARLGDGPWAGYRGELSLTRRFGRPTGLTGERVAIRFDAVSGAATAYLNGHDLGAVASPTVFEVTDQLEDRNQLEVVLVAGDDNCGIVGDVAIEIRLAVE